MSILFRTGLVVAALGVAIGIFVLLFMSRREIEHDDTAVAHPIVTSVTARERQVARAWEGYGTARSMNVADVSAEVAGRVVARPDAIEAGASIAAGDVLVEIDPVDFAQRAAAAEQAAAALEAELGGLEVEETRLREQVSLARGERDAAQRDYDRVREAVERGAGSQSEVDRYLSALRASDRVLSTLEQQLDLIPSRRAGVRARLAGERANLRVAQEDLARATVTSPISGVLQSVGPEVGERVNIGAMVARVVDLSRVEVPVRLPVSAFRSVSVGAEVELASDGPESAAWSGRIARIAPEADARARTVTVFVEVSQDPDAGGILLPGQFVVGRVSGRDNGARVVVPRRAVESDRVLVADASAEPGAASVRAAGVRVLYYVEGRFPAIDPAETEWAVLGPGSDLQPGESVIVSNLEQLRAGMVVEPRDLGAPEDEAFGGGGEG
ncbi:MAG: MexE family multidrug efflux RND transporter periplasmic adaptor subunit [Phycisphaeraceae bacterium]|nr:MAG: MexE family multidrug efflux RND transporter periplasmic adaptor subunit [Phycisphaeraceae bacterium]